MQTIQYPAVTEWPALQQRPVADAASLRELVRPLLRKVKEEGDAAVRELGSRFDKVVIDDLRVSAAELQAAAGQLPATLRTAIATAARNIETFHAGQYRAEEPVETQPGIRCWRKMVGIEKVGLYIPGGSAPLFSTVLMLGIPARIAGCRDIILCTPPDANGSIHPAIIFSAQLVGISRIFKIGGVQAIAAMAYGTETVPSVYKLFGPGNQYVTCAKQLVQEEGIAIDMPAGPSEVCVLADETANPAYVASDLLSQAEHGADSQVLLVSTNAELVMQVQEEIRKQSGSLPRKEIAGKALANSKAILFHEMADAIAFVNGYAAEHLIIACNNDEEIAEQIVNAGSVFLGNLSPESVGDYASGTNHTLPTNGFARAYSGVSVDSFVKKITYQRLTERGIRTIGPEVIAMAEAEGLQAHANAVKIRLQ